MLELEPGAKLQNEYEKMKKDAEVKLKKMFALNGARAKSISLMVILLYDREKGGSLE